VWTAVIYASGGSEAKQFLVDIPVEKTQEAVWKPCRVRTASEVSFPLLNFHRSFFVVINGAVLAFRPAEGNHLFDNLRNVSASERIAPVQGMNERTHPAFHKFVSLRKKLSLE